MSKLICQEWYAFLLSVCICFPIKEKDQKKNKVHHNFIKIDGGGGHINLTISGILFLDLLYIGFWSVGIWARQGTQVMLSYGQYL